MATFFGEILPVTSRAFDDDDDDDIDLYPANNLIVKWNPKAQQEIEKSANKRLPCSRLIITVGPAATAFAEAFILQDGYEQVGEVFSEPKNKDDDDNQNSHTDKACLIHRLQSTPGVIVCQCQTDVQPGQYFSWVEQVANSVSLSDCQVAVLCSSMTSEYKSEIPVSELSPPFLRGLKTSHHTGSLACKILEQPNMVTGLPAQVVSHCQVHGVKAVVYVCYTDSIFLDLPTIRAFKPLLNTPLLKDIAKASSSGDKMLLKIVDQQTNQSSLYL